MLKPIFSAAKNVFNAIYLLLFAALLVVLAWGSWQLYQHERSNRRFTEEGRLVTVRVTAVDRRSRAWYDQITSAAYVSFTCNGQPGEVRFKQDTAWVEVGDQLPVWYHPGLKAFRYPGNSIGFAHKPNRSRLIDFSIVNRWNNERKWLVFCLVFTTVFATLVLTALANLFKLTPLKWAARLLIGGGLLCLLFYLIYNTFQYYRYYSALKSNAKEMTVTVLATDRHALTRKTTWWYRYEADVAYGNNRKTIPIEEAEYEVLKPNDPLRVLYNEELDDMLSARFSPDHTALYGCIFLAAIGIFFGWRYLRRSSLTNKRL